jgi:DNA adenine methylase
MKKPFRYIGGKSNLVPKLLELIPSHETYVEVFCGSCALLFAKSPFISQLEVLNDFDSDIVNFYRVLRNKKDLDTLVEKIDLTPFSKEEYDYCDSTLDSLPPYSVERAYRWYILASMSIGGIIRSGWGRSIKPNGALSKVWAKIPEALQDFHYRLKKVQIDHEDFRKLIPRYDREENFLYLDPPYVPETRKAKKVYEKAMIIKSLLIYC